MSAFLCRTRGSASAETQHDAKLHSPSHTEGNFLLVRWRSWFCTHGLPVVKCLIAVGDVAEQSCAEACREKAFKSC